VIDLDGEGIVYRRFEENHPMGSCYGVQWFDPSTRHRLIAHWLGLKDKEMTWQPVESFTIVWSDKLRYLRQLGEIVEAERERLQGTVKAPHQRGFLGKDESATLAPRLIVTVQCESRVRSSDPTWTVSTDGIVKNLRLPTLEEPECAASAGRARRANRKSGCRYRHSRSGDESKVENSASGSAHQGDQRFPRRSFHVPPAA
jgi:hypothetical protein